MSYISKESIRFVFVKNIQNTTPYQGSLFFNNYKFNKKFITTWKFSHIEVTQKQLEQYFSNKSRDRAILHLINSID